MTTTIPNPSQGIGPTDGPRAPYLSRRSFLAGSLGIAAAAALAGCTDRSGATGSAASPDAASLVVAVPALAPTLDGVVGGNGISLESFEMNANLQAGLVRNPYVKGETAGTVVQDFNTYVGYLAEDYTVSADGLTYTFRLRQGLRSPLGNTINADDVIYSFERKWQTATYAKSAWADFGGPDAISKIDERTVAFRISTVGFGQTFLGLLANLQGHIYDSTALRQHSSPDDPYALEWAAANGGWGLGPYYVTSQIPDQQMILSANPHYALGEPHIQRVTLRVVTDAGTRAVLVLSGDADVAEGVLPKDQAKLSGKRGVVVPRAQNPIEYADLTLVTNKAPFDDLRIRQAFAYAIPYDEIMRQVYSGRAVPMVGNINPSTSNYSTDRLPRYTYDPRRAKDLLAQSSRPRGVSFGLTVSTATPDLVNACILIKSYAADAGFDVQIDQLSSSEFGTARTKATQQAIIYRNRCQVQTPEYACTTFFKPDDDPSSPSRWDDEMNAEFWTYIQRISANGDPLSVASGHLWEQAQTLLIESATEIFICAIQPSQVFRDGVQGFAYRSENAIDFGNVSLGSVSSS
ncbi:ABC transporter substrate-binding protein [Gordonia sp. CPCC 206044]|uniref:ABC transporter substrate-binding protein n=1 Tax=Gordonia sp. CPCC 206044 TaxID=3140793 RepID=UPI003AF3D3C2